MIMKRTSADSEIHELTRAEISRQVAALNVRRGEIVRQRASWYASAVKQGFDSSTPMVDADERAAREHAKHLLNGNAPESLSLPPDISLDKQLAREQRGIDIVLKILSDKELVALTTETVTWVEDHRAEWTRLAREIILTLLRLESLKHNAEELLGSCPNAFAVNLPIWRVGYHLQPVHPGDVPIEELKADALAEGVISQSDIRKATNVE